MFSNHFLLILSSCNRFSWLCWNLSQCIIICATVLFEYSYSQTDDKKSDTCLLFRKAARPVFSNWSWIISELLALLSVTGYARLMGYPRMLVIWRSFFPLLGTCHSWDKPLSLVKRERDLHKPELKIGPARGEYACQGNRRLHRNSMGANRPRMWAMYGDRK